MGCRGCRRDMDRFLRGFFGQGPVETEELERVRVPSVDISETEQEVLVKAELPGISKEDLDLEVRPEELLVVGQIRHEREEGGPEQTYHRRERVWQRFERRIPLPVEVKTEEVKAKLREWRTRGSSAEVRRAPTQSAQGHGRIARAGQCGCYQGGRAKLTPLTAPAFAPATFRQRSSSNKRADERKGRGLRPRPSCPFQ